MPSIFRTLNQESDQLQNVQMITHEWKVYACMHVDPRECNTAQDPLLQRDNNGEVVSSVRSRGFIDTGCACCYNAACRNVGTKTTVLPRMPSRPSPGLYCRQSLCRPKLNSTMLGPPKPDKTRCACSMGICLVTYGNCSHHNRIRSSNSHFRLEFLPLGQ